MKTPYGADWLDWVGLSFPFQTYYANSNQLGHAEAVLAVHAAWQGNEPNTQEFIPLLIFSYYYHYFSIIIIIFIAVITFIIKFILVWLVVGSNVFPKEQVSPINIKVVGLTLQSFQFQAMLHFHKIPLLHFASNIFSQRVNLFNVTLGAPITTRAITTCIKFQIFLLSLLNCCNCLTFDVLSAQLFPPQTQEY